MNNWKTIWENKTINADKQTTLQDLINADGFDSRCGGYTEEMWQLLVADFVKKATPKRGSNILEIGCGSGAFLYQLNKIVQGNLYGIDLSENLIKIARRILPKGQFVKSEANSRQFPEISFDCIFSHSVFFYFPSHSYVEEVIQIWSEKLVSGGKLILLDLNDEARKNEYYRDRLTAFPSRQAYEQYYAGLEHLHFDKKKLELILKKNSMIDITTFPHAVNNYNQSQYRFNMICTKKT